MYIYIYIYIRDVQGTERTVVSFIFLERNGIYGTERILFLERNEILGTERICSWNGTERNGLFFARPTGPGGRAGWAGPPDIPDGPSVPFHNYWNGLNRGTERNGKCWNGIDHGTERNDLERYIPDIEI